MTDDLREALRPFALVAMHDIGDDEADTDLFRQMTKYNKAPQITVGDLRRARRAYEACGEDQSELEAAHEARERAGCLMSIAECIDALADENRELRAALASSTPEEGGLSCSKCGNPNRMMCDCSLPSRVETPTVRGDEVERLRETGAFLLDRLDELETSDPEQFQRDFYGHVAPAIARFRAALSQAGEGRK